MNRWIFYYLLILTWGSFGTASSILLFDNSTGLVGHWRYSGYIYDGHFSDPPNPRLVLEFHFNEEGVDNLHWHRTDENGFCERKGRYSYDGRELKDEVFWVNPDNRSDCSRDPDMVLGKKSVTPVRAENDRLYMDLPLSEKVITYVWERIQ